MAKPPLLFLAHRIPYPPDKGDKIRSWNILRHLAKSYEIHLGGFIDDPADLVHEDRLRETCADVFLLESNAPRRMIGAARSLVRNQPLSIALWQDDRMQRWVDRRLRGDDFQHVFAYSGQMAPYVLSHVSRRRLTIMDFVDLDSDKWRQYAAETRGPQHFIYAREAKLLAQFEKAVARQVDASLFVSDEEAILFKSYAGSYAHTVYALHNGVDLDYFLPQSKIEKSGTQNTDTRGSPLIVFTGAMDYRPNIDAVTWFAEASLPLVLEEMPDAAFYIVGSKPAPDVKRLGKMTGVTVTGRVPDVRPYLRRADVAVAPMRIARGVQNKVLEAMAMGRPVVTTSRGLSGIRATGGEELLVADNAGQIADAIIQLASEPARAAEMGRAARARMELDYSWSGQLSQLDAIIAHHAEERAAT